jgi:hypothetical protein
MVWLIRFAVHTTEARQKKRGLSAARVKHPGRTRRDEKM